MKFKIIKVLILIVSWLYFFIIGYMIGGYDFINETTYKERAVTQTKLHALSMSMLNDYYKHDSDYFWDVISEGDDYYKYDSIVEHDWKILVINQ